MASLHQELQQILMTHYNELWRLNLEIWTNPELAYKEFFAHDSICAYMEKLGYPVTRHAYGIETSFEVNVQIGEPKEDTGVIVYNAEYDALPGIGHACGHNLIATASIAGFLLTVEAMKKHDIAGNVRLLGTPAEEGGGGKIDLIKCGAYKGVDACLMGHPTPTIVPGVQGVVAPLLIGACHGKITFHGFGAHAGNSPWLGKNALDAAVQAYSNIAMMRQQVEPDQRIHAIITNGGVKPNVIPEFTEMQIM
ncbi:Golgi to ER traffic- protein, partial [Ascosphaera pollenicola]